VWRRSCETRLSELLHASMALITALDLMEVDADLELEFDDDEHEHLEEPDSGEDDGAAEPIMGCTEAFNQEAALYAGPAQRARRGRGRGGPQSPSFTLTEISRRREVPESPASRRAFH
jgi:hypothetical protein